MKREKIGFGVSLGLTILFFCTFGVFGVLTCKSCNHLESDIEVEKRSQFEYFGYYDKNIELPKDKLLEKVYKNDNTICEEYYDIFFTITMSSIPLWALSFIIFGFYCDCLGL